MKDIAFVKAVASGNDFIIIDSFRDQKAKGADQIGSLAKELCRRKLSVGADGLLVIESSKKCDFKMRIFNPDGGEVDMCGNGIRCLALYAAGEGICGNKMCIETHAGNLEASVEEDRVKIKMSRPKDLRLKFDLNIDGQTYNVNYINTGVPHTVCFVQELKNFDVEKKGRAIRYHSEFQPEGTNADFIEVLDKGHIRIRTYERGVEEETLACGTGCVGAGIITVYDMEKEPRRGQRKVKVDTQSGEALNVFFNIEEGVIDQVFLEGKARIVYKAEALR